MPKIVHEPKPPKGSRRKKCRVCKTVAVYYPSDQVERAREHGGPVRKPSLPNGSIPGPTGFAGHILISITKPDTIPLMSSYIEVGRYVEVRIPGIRAREAKIRSVRPGHEFPYRVEFVDWIVASGSGQRVNCRASEIVEKN